MSDGRKAWAEIDRLRADLKHQCELNDAAGEDLDRLRVALAEAERERNALRAQLAEVERERNKFRNMVRDLCIDHRDGCCCSYCEAVFRIDAALERQP